MAWWCAGTSEKPRVARLEEVIKLLSEKLGGDLEKIEVAPVKHVVILRLHFKNGHKINIAFRRASKTEKAGP